MHSGNVGHVQELDALIRAATLFRELEDVEVAIIGGGVRRDELVGSRVRSTPGNVRFFPYQPRGALSQSLSAADVRVVALARRLAGYAVPSRLYGVLAVARPVIVAAVVESETAEIVERVGCGVVVPPGQPNLLADAIRRARDGELDHAEMGRRGRDYVTAEADRPIAMDRYRTLPAELT